MIRFDSPFPPLHRTTGVFVARGLLLDPPPPGLPRAGRGVLIVDARAREAWPGVFEAWTAGLVDEPAAPIVLEGGEASKAAGRVLTGWEALAERGLDRGSMAVVVGGGAVLDAGAFLAATWLRGLKLVLVPTTLLGQVDAGFGGKCAVDVGAAKNQAGLIVPPEALAVDPGLLGTLPAQEFRAGLGEVLKTALLAGGPLCETLEALPAAPAAADPALDLIIAGCLRAKAAIVEEDPYERGRRAVLNLGHTVAHVLEGLGLAAASPVPHGLAVAAGLIAEAEVLSESGVAARVLAAAERLGLPRRLPVPWDPRRAEALLLQDKKRRGGRWRIPVLRAPGSVEIADIEPGLLWEATRRAAGALP